MHIIDAHIHHYTDSVASNPQTWANERGEDYWQLLHTDQPNHPSLQAWPTTNQLLEHMDEANISQAILQGWYWQHLSTCIEHNNFYFDLVAKHPSRFIPFITLQPTAGQGAIDELNRCIDLGARGVGELSAITQNFDIQTNDTFHQIAQIASDNGLPMTFHVTEALGRDYLGKTQPTNLLDFQFLAQNFPDLKIILAHLGGGAAFFELNPYVKKIFKNVYYDTAAMPLLYEDRALTSLIDLVGADKVLYGSDYPLRLYPSKQNEPDFKTFLDTFKNSDTIDLDKILYSNIHALISK